MTNTSVFRRHRDLFWALLLSALVTLLSFYDIISFTSFSPLIPISILLGIGTGTVGLFSFYQKYSPVIARSKKQGKRDLIKSVFMFPIVFSILGVIFVILANGVQLEAISDFSEYHLLVIHSLGDGILTFLITYSLVSFSEAASFVYRVMEGQAT